ncbi:hypothetical protein RI367_004023 [Sorochytrium milnesiophthora]
MTPLRPARLTAPPPMLLLLLLLLLAWMASTPVVLADLTVPVLRWTRLDVPDAASKPSPRKDFTFVYDRKTQKVLLFGGRSQDGTPLEDTWTLQVTSDKVVTWVQKDLPLHPPARFSAVAGPDMPGSSVRQGIIVAAGMSANGRVLNDVWAYHTTFDKWYPLATTGTPPAPRYSAVGGVAPSDDEECRMYVAYGTDDKTKFQDLYTLSVTGSLTNYNYSTATAVWSATRESDARPPGSSALTGGMLPGERLVTFGGCAAGGRCPSGEGWMISPDQKKLSDGGTWKQVDSCPQPRTAGALAYRPDIDDKQLLQRQAVMYGGTYGRDKVGAQGEVAFFDSDGGSWVNIIPSRGSGGFPGARSNAGFVAHEDTKSVLLFGGEGANGVLTNDLWMLEFYTSGAAAGFDNQGILNCYKPTDYRVAHGALMAVGFGVLLPASVFLARYLKPQRRRATQHTAAISPLAKQHKPSQLWYYLHLGTSLMAVACIATGFALIYVMQIESHFNTVHSWIGVVVLALLALLLLFALVQPRHFRSMAAEAAGGAPFDANNRPMHPATTPADARNTIQQTLRQLRQMDRGKQHQQQQQPRRQSNVSAGSPGINGFTYVAFWNAAHQYSGLLIMYCAFVNILLGLLLLQSATTWIIVYCVYLGLLLLAFIVLTLLNKPHKRAWSVVTARRLLRKKPAAADTDVDHPAAHAPAAAQTAAARRASNLDGDTDDESGDSDRDAHDDDDDGADDQDLDNREVVVMTIPKRRLQVVNG